MSLCRSLRVALLVFAIAFTPDGYAKIDLTWAAIAADNFIIGELSDFKYNESMKTGEVYLSSESTTTRLTFWSNNPPPSLEIGTTYVAFFSRDMVGDKEILDLLTMPSYAIALPSEVSASLLDKNKLITAMSAQYPVKSCDSVNLILQDLASKRYQIGIDKIARHQKNPSFLDCLSDAIMDARTVWSAEYVNPFDGSYEYGPVMTTGEFIAKILPSISGINFGVRVRLNQSRKERMRIAWRHLLSSEFREYENSIICPQGK